MRESFVTSFSFSDAVSRPLRPRAIASAEATLEPTNAPVEAGDVRAGDARAGGVLAGRSGFWVPALIVGLLLVVLYAHIAVKLVRDWYDIPDFSHGFLIPFFVAFLVWDKRREIAETRWQPSWGGVPLVVLGLCELLIGIFGADLFLQRTSFVLLVSGLVWTLIGRPMVRTVKFPLLVLLLAIPLPTVVFNQITFPLQLLASRFASELLPLAGVPVLREGNVIQLPVMQLEVAEACSGIRSLMSLFTVAVIYGYFLERGRWRRVLLALAALPIAVAANVARIFGTGLCVQYWDPAKATGFFHEFSGWLMFLVSLSLLYVVHTGMRLVAPEGEAKP
ncbi:MAG: exosortase/archaeosortase family protein [Acidobacteriota bacterium]|nr:exosortase/archaeosortase family protein [Acidobacteriota bacterium]